MFYQITNVKKKRNNMTELQTVLAKLNVAHTSPNRDVNEVARLFTQANNLGAGLKAFNFITNKPVERGEDTYDMSGEEFFRNKIREQNPNREVVTLSQELITAEQGLLWAHEFKQLHLHVVSKFDMQKFKEYVQTYDAKKNGLDNDNTIVKDMLYGIGLCLNKKEFEFADGFKKFKTFIKAFL